MTPIKHRDSSLELYRIIVMLAIVAHHYVANSGLMPIVSGGGMTFNKLFLLCLGAWGKVGINCFVLITGYFMCTSSITLKKFLKLYLEIVFYNVVLNAIFVFTGYAPLTFYTVLYSLFPVYGITTDCFWGAFTMFFLTIPFLNVLVSNLNRRQHQLLIILCIVIYSILPMLPRFEFEYNHVEWFAVLYFISSYLRKYPTRVTENRSLWGWLSVAALACGFLSVIVMKFIAHGVLKYFGPYYWLTDANRITALTASICFFLYFKNMRMRYSAIVNAVASAVFGVLLIHANSSAMRNWLWNDVCNCVGWFQSHGDSTLLVMAHVFGCVIAIFIACVVIDLLRQYLIEKPLFRLWRKEGV